SELGNGLRLLIADRAQEATIVRRQQPDQRLGRFHARQLCIDRGGYFSPCDGSHLGFQRLSGLYLHRSLRFVASSSPTTVSPIPCSANTRVPSAKKSATS